MEPVLGKASKPSGMQRCSQGGMALLPWSRHILGVLWDHVRFMLHVICCSLMNVFHMFRFEVHLRITDDTGEHIQHITNGPGDTEGFLLSSLFENNKNVVVGGSGQLSKFNNDPFQRNSHSKSVLSSLVDDDFCCSLVDNFVSRATECLNDNEEVCVGEQCGWNQKFEWNFHTGLEGIANEECVSRVYDKGIQKQSGCCTGLERNMSWIKLKSQISDSELSWGSSEGSTTDREREDTDGLWDLLRCSNDPYHPLHFTACISSEVNNTQGTHSDSNQQRNEFKSTPCSVSCCSDSSGHENSETVSSEDEEEVLWKSLSRDDDPYHPLNFRAHLYDAHAFTNSNEKSTKIYKDSTSTRCPKPMMMQRQVISHWCPELCAEKPAKIPWRRSINYTVDASMTKRISQKKVKFSPVVQIHRMRTWSFARQACRKGPWEEYARDRERFQRRIFETEQAIGYCFMQSHRDTIFGVLSNHTT